MTFCGPIGPDDETTTGDMDISMTNRGMGNETVTGSGEGEITGSSEGGFITMANDCQEEFDDNECCNLHGESTTLPGMCAVSHPPFCFTCDGDNVQCPGFACLDSMGNPTDCCLNTDYGITMSCQN